MAVILIAGGATGIGRATALAFSRQGDSVLLADRDGAGARAVMAAAGSGRIAPLELDLASAAAPSAAVEAAIATFGALDTVFVAAALLASAPLRDWTAEMWERSSGLNLRMPFLLAQAAAPHLARSDNGCIIFTASTGALRGHAGMPAYHGTKTALLGLCRSLADELGPQGVRINCILPGWIDTPFNDPFWASQPDPAAARAALEVLIPLRRQGVPEDVSSAVLFLASSAARYITGTSLVVDGGYTAV